MNDIYNEREHLASHIWFGLDAGPVEDFHIWAIFFNRFPNHPHNQCAYSDGSTAADPDEQTTCDMLHTNCNQHTNDLLIYCERRFHCCIIIVCYTVAHYLCIRGNMQYPPSSHYRPGRATSNWKRFSFAGDLIFQIVPFFALRKFLFRAFFLNWNRVLHLILNERIFWIFIFL